MYGLLDNMYNAPQGRQTTCTTYGLSSVKCPLSPRTLRSLDQDDQNAFIKLSNLNSAATSFTDKVKKSTPPDVHQAIK